MQRERERELHGLPALLLPPARPRLAPILHPTALPPPTSHLAQAKKMADSMGNMSESHMELLAKLTRWVNRAIDAYQAAKAALLSQGLLVLALLVLLLAVVLRWAGWV